MNFLKKNKAGFYLLLLSLPAAVAAILSLTAAGRPGSAPPPAAKKQPNVVVVLVDQWRGQAMGFLHKEKVLTPNLDTLARGGLALTQMVSNFPLCSPARAMLMTGNYPIKTKVYTNVNSLSAPYGIELPASTTCWSGPSMVASKRSARSCARAQACDHSMAVNGPLRLASKTANCNDA